MSTNPWTNGPKRALPDTLPNSNILRVGNARVYGNAKRKCNICSNLECECRKCQVFKGRCGRGPDSTECTFDKDLSNNCIGFEL